MPYTLTRLQIETRARRKADAVSDPHISDTELHDECNDLISYAQKLVLAEDADRFTTSTTIAATTGTYIYAVPADFQSLRRLNDPDGIMVEPAPMLELAFGDEAASGGVTRYRLVGGGVTGSNERLHLRPGPVTGNYELWYVTTAPTLGADGSTYDCRFDEHVFVIAGLALFIALKQQSTDIPYFMAERERAEAHVREMAKKRDHSRAKQITDVVSQRSDWRPRYPRP